MCVCVSLCGGQQTPTAGWGAWVCWPASWESAGVYGSGLIDLSLDERDGQAVLCVRMRTECQRTQFHVRREPRALGSASLRLCLLLCGDRDLAALYNIHTISILSIWYMNFAENSHCPDTFCATTKCSLRNTYPGVLFISPFSRFAYGAAAHTHARVHMARGRLRQKRWPLNNSCAAHMVVCSDEFLSRRTVVPSVNWPYT